MKTVSDIAKAARDILNGKKDSVPYATRRELALMVAILGVEVLTLRKEVDELKKAKDAWEP